jgi:hypothetical protein
MLCAVADALGARDGVVVTDRLSPTSGITYQYTQWVVTIRPGRPEEALGPSLPVSSDSGRRLDSG